jgi:hypothetical protein
VNLDQLANKEQILTAAFSHPALQIGKKSKIAPTLEEAMAVVVRTIEYEVTSNVAQAMEPVFVDILEQHELLDGDWETSDYRSDWEAAIDQKVEDSIAEWEPFLSADWLGRNMIGCNLHVEKGCYKLAQSLGREVFKQLTHGKTPAQVMSSAGVVTAEVEAALNNHINAFNQSLQENANMAYEPPEDLMEVIARIADHVGKDFNQLAVYDDLDLASDDDEILANGAGERLGIDHEDVAILQAARFEHEGDTAQVLVTLLEESFSNKKKAAKKKPTAEAVAAAETKAKSKKKTKTTEGAVSANVISTLKNIGADDKTMAEGLGVSRPTYNNWGNGKSACVLSDEQRAWLRGQIVERANGLLEILGELDGVEPDMVF